MSGTAVVPVVGDQEAGSSKGDRYTAPGHRHQVDKQQWPVINYKP